MGAILGTLSELGYGWAYRVLDAQFFGVPQRRRRVFIVGCVGGRSDRAREVLFEPESLRGDSPPSREAGKEIAGTLGGRSAGSHTELDGHGAYVVPSYSLTTEQTPKFARNVALTLTKQSPSGGGQTQAVLSFAQNQRGELRTSPISPQLTTGGGKPGEGYPAVFISGDGTQIVPAVTSKWAKGGGGPAGDECQNLLAFVPEITGALSDGAHHGGGLNGQDAYSGRICAPSGVVRRLTPLECERLQGFPDNWTAGQTDGHRYRQVGNAVAVPVIEWIAKRIASYE